MTPCARLEARQSLGAHHRLNKGGYPRSFPLPSRKRPLLLRLAMSEKCQKRTSPNTVKEPTHPRLNQARLVSLLILVADDRGLVRTE
jgi:hypothetical protein